MGLLRSRDGNSGILDRAMSSARELGEHQYSEGGLLFPWLTNKRKLKVLERDLRPMYFTAVLMRNCYTCMYHG